MQYEQIDNRTCCLVLVISAIKSTGFISYRIHTPAHRNRSEVVDVMLSCLSAIRSKVIRSRLMVHMNTPRYST